MVISNLNLYTVYQSMQLFWYVNSTRCLKTRPKLVTFKDQFGMFCDTQYKGLILNVGGMYMIMFSIKMCRQLICLTIWSFPQFWQKDTRICNNNCQILMWHFRLKITHSMCQNLHKAQNVKNQYFVDRLTLNE